MKKSFYPPLILIVTLLLAAGISYAQPPAGKMAYTVSMDQPASHYYKVELRYDGNTGESVDLKMPAWTPGYYMILDLAKNVVEFDAMDAANKPLAWEKTAKNTWHITTAGVKTLMVSYYVFANRASVAEPYLAENRGFISPTGVFMHVAGKLNHPVTVTVKPYSEWKQVSTGLDPVKGSLNTFSATDFDRLYDCPILVGNQEVLTFEFKGIPHCIAIEKPGSCDRLKLTADLERIIEAGTSIIGEIPYKHYTFIIMDKGPGGLEHLNSMAVFADLSNYQGTDKDRGLLGFIAHEYFHLYNVKSIRPVVLGPFDYDRECITNMLWFSEGGTSYYEEIILNRAGFLTRDGFLENAGKTIGSHENIVGHEFQSVALASRDTWMLFFNRNENSQSVTINYYNKGATLAMLLDLKIRYESKNVNSLDDVMRSLYQDYNKSKNRGFTDQEFRQACEKAAGCSLAELFDYVYTTNAIDYAKYLGYAGLNIDLTPQEPAITHLDKSINKRSFKITLMENPSVLQKKVMEDWLK
ncbi:MAG: M61 family peptidase [Bacteroidia bacterium]|nr:M61 family peptidase [Bacteroidia bacterium]